MKFIIFLALMGCLYFTASASHAKGEDHLAKCWKQQGETLHENYLKLSFYETVNRLYHSMAPWQTYASAPFGILSINAHHFFKHDTIKGKKADHSAITEFDLQNLLMTDFGDTALQSVTVRDVQ